ncbi:hypothetical protein HY358_00375 [Candidatus Roizmanbacteria bacterium]|nr:hypothetical protein [Candidatus Roizmanbacteria bacterium]
MKKRKLSLYIISSLILATCYILCTTLTHAITPTLESPQYRLEWGNVNVGGNEESSKGYKLSTTLGQLAAGNFSSNGYVVKAGFQYLHSIIPFRFSVSNTTINLGSLTPNVSATATTTLTVYFGAAGNYQVTASEMGPLQTLTGNNTIPDTKCDGGNNTCSETIAKIWTSSSAYGFGYNMTGQDTPSDFSSNNSYRPFADLKAGKQPVIVMSNTNVGKNRQSTMMFKANVSPIQVPGSYQTIINLVATPSF